METPACGPRERGPRPLTTGAGHRDTQRAMPGAPCAQEMGEQKGGWPAANTRKRECDAARAPPFLPRRTQTHARRAPRGARASCGKKHGTQAGGDGGRGSVAREKNAPGENANSSCGAPHFDACFHSTADTQCGPACVPRSAPRRPPPARLPPAAPCRRRRPAGRRPSRRRPTRRALFPSRRANPAPKTVASPGAKPACGTCTRRR